MNINNNITKYKYKYIYTHTRDTEITEKGNFRLFAGNYNGKREFVFLDRQTINGN